MKLLYYKCCYVANASKVFYSEMYQSLAFCAQKALFCVNLRYLRDCLKPFSDTFTGLTTKTFFFAVKRC